MSTVVQKTPQQLLRDFCADFGLPKQQLRANEEFQGGSCDGEVAIIRVDRYTVEDTGNARLITGHATRLLVLRAIKTDKVRWMVSPNECMTVPDLEWKTVRMPRYGVKSVREYMESREWARLSFRAGTSRFPLDSFGGTFEVGQYPANQQMPERWYR